jgi:pimeloyl-ACP methyl ester carboxylesterase
MVEGLLLADPSGDARKLPDEQFEPFLAALDSDSYAGTVEEYWRAMLAGSNPSIQEKVLKDMLSTKKEVVIGVFRSTLGFDPIAALSRYPGKKLSVITHLNDTPISLHSLLPDLPHVRVSGTGHWLQLDRPDEFNRIMDDFLFLI